MRGLKKQRTFFEDPHMAAGAETDKRKPSQQETKQHSLRPDKEQIIQPTHLGARQIASS